MSSDSYKSFAVVGAGPTIGLPIIQAWVYVQPLQFLLERNASVIVLTRPSSSKDLPHGAKLVAVDYSDVDVISSVLRQHSVDVLVSTLNGEGGLLSQYLLSDAAKAAGVKLFVPSEFGMPTNDSMWGLKNRVAVHAKTIGLPTLRLFIGSFSEGVPWLSTVDQTGKFLILGKGETYISFTAIPDIAAYLAYVLTALPPTQLNDTILRIEGDRATLREIGALYEGKAPVEFVDSIPHDTLFAQIKEDILKRYELGAGSTGWDHTTNKDSPELAGEANKLYPEFKWKSVKETLGL
ncbi:hypothetical protein F5I97DRAFT_1814656 [Phlebopus sp. FC_14]|nr:hypothetical protein F5I97DRAFT_1814656 [Phlebopus sp. FC_14]